MKLQNDNELENTQRKLAGLLAMIREKERAETRSGAYEWSLASMKEMAKRLQTEIEEYQGGRSPRLAPESSAL